MYFFILFLILFLNVFHLFFFRMLYFRFISHNNDIKKCQGEDLNLNFTSVFKLPSSLALKEMYNLPLDDLDLPLMNIFIMENRNTILLIE